MLSYPTILQWLNAHRSIAYDLIRIYLGIALFVRGMISVADSSVLMALLDQQGRDWLVPMALVHYIALAHLVGGLMIAAGLLTRIAALLQLPILFGAVFLIHLEEGLLAAGQSLELSALVLFLLVLFFLFGSGRYSADYYIYSAEAEGEQQPEASRSERAAPQTTVSV